MTWARPRNTYHRHGALSERQLERKIMAQVLDKVQPRLDQLLKHLSRPDASVSERLVTPSRKSVDVVSERSSAASLETPQVPARTADAESVTRSGPNLRCSSSNCRSLLDMGVPEIERLQSIYRQDFNPYFQHQNAELEAERVKEKQRNMEERWKRGFLTEPAQNSSGTRLPGEDLSHSCSANDSKSQKGKPTKCDAKVGTSPHSWIRTGHNFKSASDLERIIRNYYLSDQKLPLLPRTKSIPQRPAGAPSRRPRKFIPRKQTRDNLPSLRASPIEPIYPVEFAATFSPTRAAFRCPSTRKMATINRGKKMEKIRRISQDRIAVSRVRVHAQADTLSVPSVQRVDSSSRGRSPSSTGRSSREEKTWSQKAPLFKKTGTSTSIYTEGTTDYRTPTSSEPGRVKGILKKPDP